MAKVLTVEESILSDPKCFSHWLYRYRERIRAGYEREDISLDVFRSTILRMISRSAEWAGRFGFECDLNRARTKEQILQRCETAVAKAARVKRKRYN